MADQDQDQGQDQNPDVSFPGNGENEGAGGLLTGIADVADMADVVPLLGTAANLIKAGVDGGNAIYHGANAKDSYNDGDIGGGGREMDKAEESERAMAGDFINAIPLVGTARALM